MSDPLESKFKQRVKKDLDSLPNCYYFVKEAGALRGIPDIIGCVKGRFFGLELKRNRQEATKSAGRVVLQRYHIRQINAAGGEAFITWPDTWDITFKILKNLAEGITK